ncbi:major facilitator superfamily domain-containing protein [Lipomyces doorenjongii]
MSTNDENFDRRTEEEKKSGPIFEKIDELSSDSEDESVYGAIAGKLNIPDDWPPLAAHPPKKYYFWQINGPGNIDLDGIATQASVFDDPEKARLHQPTEKYENLHRLDPRERWTWREEIKLVRKIDLRIMVWVAFMFMALQLDRGNISQAVADNMLTDLGFSTNVFNNGNSIFKAVFLVSEVPSQLISKKLGPDRWIPIQMVLWSAVAMSQYGLQSKSGFYITRALLGALEGGFIADVCLYLSYFYTAIELPVRLAYFWAALTLSDICAAFMGFGILHMRGVHGKEGWRWLFLIEGGVTLVVGLLSVLIMPPSPTKTASWIRGKNGWFTEREEKIIVNRVLRDDPNKGDMHNRQALNFRMLWDSLCDFDLWPIYLIGLVFGMPSSPVGTYLTLTFRGLGFTTLQTTLLVLPQQLLSLVTLLAITYLSQMTNERSYMGILAQLMHLGFMIPLRIFSQSTNRWVRYSIVSLFLASPSTHAIQVGWTSRNSNTVRTRTLSAAMYNMFCQLSGIISSYIYRADDKPLYHRGNSDILGILAMNLVIYAGVKVYYVARNKRRERKWKAFTEEERRHYLLTTTDKGNKRLDFRFAH